MEKGDRQPAPKSSSIDAILKDSNTVENKKTIGPGFKSDLKNLLLLRKIGRAKPDEVPLSIENTQPVTTPDKPRSQFKSYLKDLLLLRRLKS